eukprot:scaffold34836_cov129-Isochrysis_galbana.AAC.2
MPWLRLRGPRSRRPRPPSLLPPQFPRRPNQRKKSQKQLKTAAAHQAAKEAAERAIASALGAAAGGASAHPPRLPIPVRYRGANPSVLQLSMLKCSSPSSGGG